MAERKISVYLLFLLTLCSVAAQAQSAAVGVAKDANIIGRELTLDFYVANLGSEVLTNFSLQDNLDAVLGAGTYRVTTPAFRAGGDATITVNSAFDGSGNIDLISGGYLDPGTRTWISVSVTMSSFTDQGSGPGIYSNQVTISADGGGTTVSDVSDAGTNPDPNGNGDAGDPDESDPTPIIFFENTALGVAKTATQDGNQITFDLYIENYGNVTMNDLSLTDDLFAVFGEGPLEESTFNLLSGPTLMSDPGTINVNAGYDGLTDTELISSGSLGVGGSAQIRIVAEVILVVDQGLGFGVYSNQATVSGTSPGGRFYSDLSDSGANPDPNGDGDPKDDGENDPTIFTLGEAPSIGIALNATVGGSVVTFDVYLENLGNTDLTGLTVPHVLAPIFGESLFDLTGAPTLIDDPGTLVLNESYDGEENDDLLAGGSLAPGDTAQIQYQVTVYTLSDVGLGNGNYRTQVEVEAVSPNGGAAYDLSDAGTDPDPDGDGNADEPGENDATDFTLTENGSIGVATNVLLLGEAVASIDVGGNVTTGIGSRVVVNVLLENLGNVSVTDLSLTQDLVATFGSGNFGTYNTTAQPELVNDPGTIVRNPLFNGSTDTGLLLAGSYLGPGEFVQLRYELLVTNVTDQGNGFGVYQTQVTGQGNAGIALVSDLSAPGNDPDPNGNGNPSDAGEDDPLQFVIGGYLGASQTVSVGGTDVTFDVYLENFGSTTLSDVVAEVNLNAPFAAGNFTLISAPSLIDDPGTLILNGGYDGADDVMLLDASSTLAGGDTAHIQFTARVTKLINRGSGLGNYTSQAYVAGVQPGGVAVYDYSDAGTDPDENGDGNPASLTASEDDANNFSVTSDAVTGAALNIAVDEQQVTIDFYLENFGTGSLGSLALPYDLDALLGVGNYTIDSAPALVDDPGTLTLNPAYDGSSDTALLSGSLAGGDTARIQLVVTIDTVIDSGSGLGVYSSQVTLTGYDGNGVLICDKSDGGTEPDLNGDGDPTQQGLADPPVDGEDDPTLFVIGSEAIGLAIHSTVSGNIVTFDYYIENLSGGTISAISISQNLFSVFGFNNYATQTAAVLMEGPATISPNAAFDGTFQQTLLFGGSLAAGEMARVRYSLVVNNITNGGVYNTTATVVGTGSTGSLSDISDDGLVTDANGNGNPNEAGENDQTLTILGEETVLGVSRTATVSGTQVTLDTYLENLGNVTVSSIALEDNLDAIFGAGNYALVSGPSLVDDPGTLALDGAYDGTGATAVLASASSSMAAGATAQIQTVVNITNIADLGFGTGVYETQVLVTGSGPSNTAAGDYSNDSTDPDPNGDGNPAGSSENSVTVFAVGTTAIGAAFDATVSGDLVSFEYTFENLGNTSLSNFSAQHDLDALFGAGNYSIVSALIIGGNPHALEPNEGFDGSSDTQLFGGGSQLPGVADSFVLTVRVDHLIDPGHGVGVYSDQIQVSAESSYGSVSDLSDAGTITDSNGNNQADDEGEDDPTNFTIAERAAFGAAKTAAVFGRAVTFDLYLESWGNVDLVNVDVSDNLDSVFGVGNYSITAAPSLIAGPATVSINPSFDGSSDTNLLSGSSSMAAYETAQVRFEATVSNLSDQGFGLGSYQNQAAATAITQGGQNLSDLSDAGSEPDSNGNEQPGDAGEDDPTAFELNGSISGWVYNDQNANGLFDVGEPGLNGVTVFIDDNENGTPDAGEASVSTDGDGSYSFGNLAAGSYNVAVDESTIPAGYEQSGGTNPQTILLGSGEEVSGVDFGYRSQTLFIAGRVWEDDSHDGTYDPGEQGLGDVTLALYLTTGEFVTEVATDSDGIYTFDDLAPGNYKVRITDRNRILMGFVRVDGGPPYIYVTLGATPITDVDFALCRKPGIIKQPSNTTACEGDEVSFSVQAVGTNLAIQWYHDGEAIPGATSATYTIPSVQQSDAGVYYATLINGCGQKQTRHAPLRVPKVIAKIHEIPAQGLTPIFLRASHGCGTGAVSFQWRNMETGELIDVGESLLDMPMQDETTYVELTATDALGYTGEDVAAILVGEEPSYADLNGDGCNSLADVWSLLGDWQQEVDSLDANGDGRIDIRDYIYINATQSECD